MPKIEPSSKCPKRWWSDIRAVRPLLDRPRRGRFVRPVVGYMPGRDPFAGLPPCRALGPLGCPGPARGRLLRFCRTSPPGYAPQDRPPAYIAGPVLRVPAAASDRLSVRRSLPDRRREDARTGPVFFKKSAKIPRNPKNPHLDDKKRPPAHAGGRESGLKHRL